MSSAENTSGPLLSVVMPTFNRASMICRAIDSLVAQRFGDWELVIVDDGSTDDTPQTISRYKDDRIRYLRKENEERSIARNFGISHARGLFVNFLDSDDFVEIDHLELAAKTISQRPEVKIFHLGYSMLNIKTGERLNRPLPTTEGLLRALLSENPLSGNAIFIRRELLDEVRFAHSRHAVIGEDWCLWLRLAARHLVHFERQVTSHIVEHAGRSTATIDPDTYRRATFASLDTLDSDAMFVAAVGASAYRRFRAEQLMGVALNYLINAKFDKIQALQFIRMAAHCDLRALLTKRFAVCIKKLITR